MNAGSQSEFVKTNIYDDGTTEVVRKMTFRVITGVIILPDDVVQGMERAEKIDFRFYLGEFPCSFQFESITACNVILDEEEVDTISINEHIDYGSNLVVLRKYLETNTKNDYLKSLMPRKHVVVQNEAEIDDDEEDSDF